MPKKTYGHSYWTILNPRMHYFQVVLYSRQFIQSIRLKARVPTDTPNTTRCGHTCTASASISTPLSIAARPSTPNLISFPEAKVRFKTRLLFRVVVFRSVESILTWLGSIRRFPAWRSFKDGWSCPVLFEENWEGKAALENTDQASCDASIIVALQH